ncbi:tafazzin-like [Haliotis rufescens]|uniref:tafazzin-like n=1 Tax=Haliotis rufescens TaxID=6454 RepID=UPI001EB03D52|nr:tafazzin-like [Haliotis rufescens]
MPLGNGWLFPSKPTFTWNVSSRFTVAMVGTLSKFWLEWLNTLNVHNRTQLYDAIENRPKEQGLVTVTNHHSCLDDPILWGMLKIRYVMDQSTLRWTLAAEDVCFTKYWHALFFSLGKTVPVVRGAGVYQRSVDYMLEKLHLGEWVHMFPEGKVNETHQQMRLKWGVGRLISESNITPLVLPMFHFGMDDVLPNKTPYIPLIKKKVTVLIGKPIDFQEELAKLRELKKTPREIRKRLTDLIQEELSVLKDKAHILHNQHIHRGR